MTRKHPNDCGNAHVDGLAARGRMANVWTQLERRFAMVAAHAQEVWIARRDGRVRRAIETDPRFTCLRAPEGPTSDAEWTLLATAALEAAGLPPTGELDRADGLWLGMPEGHPVLVKRHEGCAFCSTPKPGGARWRPCPTTGYPMAHV